MQRVSEMLTDSIKRLPLTATRDAEITMIINNIIIIQKNKISSAVKILTIASSAIKNIRKIKKDVESITIIAPLFSLMMRP